MKTTKINTVPVGMIPHTDDSSKHGYPAGVDHNTIVDVVINCDGNMFLYRSEAQSFGWQIAPHAPAYAGLRAVAAPITHYSVVKGGVA